MLKNLKVAQKLIGGFATMAVIALVIGLVGLAGIRALDGDLDDVSIVRLPSVAALQQIATAQSELASANRVLLNP
ncbi:MAG: MCP four helix bundle domain-containing protein, partial [Gemmatimonadaceae bacterium]